MDSDLLVALVGGAVALAALGLVAFSVARMSSVGPVRVVAVIVALTGFIAAMPPLIAAFASFRK